MSASTEQDTLILSLCAKGLNGAQIAEIIGVSRSAICNRLRVHGIEGKQYSYIKELTPWQDAVILGTLMGDGCLKRVKPHHNAHFKMSHGPKQLDYIRWKAEQFPEFFIKKEPTPYMTKDGYPTYKIASSSHPLFTEYYEFLYPNKKKRVNKEVLERIAALDFRDAALAIWYMDNGSTKYDNARLALDGYDDTQYNLLAEWFTSLGWPGVLEPTDSNCKVYCMRKSVSATFFTVIAPYMVPCLAYKIPLEYRSIR